MIMQCDQDKISHMFIPWAWDRKFAATDVTWKYAWDLFAISVDNLTSRHWFMLSHDTFIIVGWWINEKLI